MAPSKAVQTTRPDLLRRAASASWEIYSPCSSNVSQVIEAPGIPLYLHVLNLNEFSRVCQLKLPVVFSYSWAYQNVQSSTGSMDMLE